MKKIKKKGNILWFALQYAEPHCEISRNGEITDGYLLQFYSPKTCNEWNMFVEKDEYEKKEAKRRKYSRGVLDRSSREYKERGEQIEEQRRKARARKAEKRRLAKERRESVSEEKRKYYADVRERYLCKKLGITSLKESDEYYRHGNHIRRYKTKKHNVKARERYYKNRKPSNVSKDYSFIVSDKQEDGTLVFNSKKAETFAKQIELQFLWKKTTINFTDTNGLDRIAREPNDIVPLILENKVDLSKGLYFSQYIHMNISRTNPKYYTHDDIDLYHEVKRYMRKGCKVIFYIKHKDQKQVIFDTDKLSLFKKVIDWNRDVRVISKYPIRIKSKRWNLERGGAWKDLSRLVSLEHAEKFKSETYFRKPLKDAGIVKSWVDLAAFERGDRAVHGTIRRFSKFSYDKCQKALKGETIKLILKKFPDLILNTTPSLEKFYSYIEDSLRTSRFQHRLTKVVQSFIAYIYETILKNTGVFKQLTTRKESAKDYLMYLRDTDYSENGHNYIQGNKNPTPITFYSSITKLKERARNIRNGYEKDIYEKYMTDRRLWHAYEKDECEA